LCGYQILMMLTFVDFITYQNLTLKLLILSRRRLASTEFVMTIQIQIRIVEFMHVKLWQKVHKTKNLMHKNTD